MAVIAFVKRGQQPPYRIKKASQAIWVAPNGDTTFNLECIVDVQDVHPTSPMNEVTVLTYGSVSRDGVKEENKLFLDASFCDYLYDGRYECKSQDFVKLLVASDDEQYVRIARIRDIQTSPEEACSRIRVFFSPNLCSEENELCQGVVRYVGFRIKYTIPKYAKRIKRRLYTEPTWTIDLRPYDDKVLGQLARNEEIVDLEYLYYWVVLPRGFFTTAHAPPLHQIRCLEVNPWRAIYPGLQEDSICYSWKLTSPISGNRLHIDFREPSFESRWAFWAFLITAVALIITLVFFLLSQFVFHQGS